MLEILQFAVCPNCEQKFNVRDYRGYHGQRIPLILNCGHTYCEPCIRTAIEKKTKGIKCGICDYFSAFNGSVKEIRDVFPLHLFLFGLCLSKAHDKRSEEPILSFQPLVKKVEFTPKKV